MRKKLLIILLVLLVASGLLAGYAHLFTEYLWFEHLGFGSVFTTRLFSQVGLGVGFGLLALVYLLLNVVLIRRFSKPREVWAIPTAAGDVIDMKDVVRRVTTPVVVSAAVLVAAIMGYWATRHWEEALKFVNRTPFGQSEPILGQDIGFYLFRLPLMEFVQEWLVYLTGIALVFSAAVYFLRSAVTLKGRELLASHGVRAHLLGGMAIVLLVIAWGWRLEMFETLFSKRGVAYGATYTDVYVNLVVYRIMIGACILAALFFVYLIFRRLEGPTATKQPAYALGGLFLLYLLGSFVAPFVVQKFMVAPNELDREKPYLVHAIAGTRAAYGLDNIEVQEFPATESLTVEDLERNKPTIDNIKIWDNRPLQATYKQMQAIRLYYDFPSINVDRYHAENQYWQVMLSTRELVVDQLPEESQTWVNRHLQYTHGHGLCLSPVKRVVGEGLPDLWVKDIPPQSRYPHLKIDRPEVYFGQETSDYVLVNTRTQEFDYPKGSENVYTTYRGRAGIGIGSFWRRVLFAIRFGDVNLFFTKYLTPESRVLFNRTIHERVETLAPFLMLDGEPYMVVADGRLFWIQDAYTISYRYPYSQPTPLGRRKRINYIRNSVKVVIDAYHGDVSFYLWDQKDPMIRTYAKIFPALFKPASQMPASVRPHVRYPQDLFAVQAVQYESFHMTDPRIFYNKEDKWTVSDESVAKMKDEAATTPAPNAAARARAGIARMDLNYMIMRLPGEKQEEFLLMAPYTPVNKKNMVAWMTARCDGENYGKLLVYTFPKQKLVFGPAQVEARISQDTYISQWITLRNQHGSQVIRGDLLVIPIKDAILYVEPIFLQSTQTQLPELKQVVVAFGKRLTMKENLRLALQEVFDISDDRVAHALFSERLAGERLPPSTRPAARTPDLPASLTAGPILDGARSLLERAQQHYRAGKEKVSKGDWAGYGAEQEKLKHALDELADLLERRLSPPAPGR
jgi:uncharacterized membrane protein (UPF0182 family)